MRGEKSQSSLLCTVYFERVKTSNHDVIVICYANQKFGVGKNK